MIPDGWQQGRGAFGGLVVAELVDAAMKTDPRPPRALTCEIFGPVQPGAAEITTEVLKAGSGVSTVEVRLAQDELLARATVLLGKTRVTDHDASVWRAPDIELVPALKLPSPPAPIFIQHFDLHPSRTAFPYSGVASDTAEGFVRCLEPGGYSPHALVAMHIDAWWPIIATGFSGFRPMATIAFSLTWHTLPAPNAMLKYRGRTLAANDGYVTELRELYTTENQLCAVNQQTFAIIR